MRKRNGRYLVSLQADGRLKHLAGLAQDFRHSFGGIRTGAALQNVYLYCTSEGLAAVAREQSDYAELSKVFNLSPTQLIILALSVCYPPDTK